MVISGDLSANEGERPVDKVTGIYKVPDLNKNV